MSKQLELQPGEQVFYRTASSQFARYSAGCLGIFALPFFGLGLVFLLGWGSTLYSDVVITSHRVMLKKSGPFRKRYRSIPLDQIYLVDGFRRFAANATLEAGLVQEMGQRVELDLLDGKTVHITIPRANVFMARLQDAANAEPASRE